MGGLGEEEIGVDGDRAVLEGVQDDTPVLNGSWPVATHIYALQTTNEARTCLALSERQRMFG